MLIAFLVQLLSSVLDDSLQKYCVNWLSDITYLFGRPGARVEVSSAR